MFAYCGNNPVNYSDPSGNAFTDIFAVCFGGTASFRVIASSDGQEDSDMLLEHVLDCMIPSHGYAATARVEYLGVYSKQANIVMDVGMSLAGKIAAKALATASIGGPPAVILYIISEAASVYGDIALLNDIGDEMDGLANKDYDQYKVIVSWTQADSVEGFPGAIRRSHYYAEIICLWNDTRRNNEFWYVQQYTASVSDEFWGMN